jgi:predicted RNA-binding Zn-ribbon protein involved in translation (DUF1610 family)
VVDHTLHPAPGKKLFVGFRAMWNSCAKVMSEFKFACPVCGQHITADSAATGTQLDCPTCFRKIVVPQAPASTDPKFILSATEANKPRPPQAATRTHLGPIKRVSERMHLPLWVFFVAVAACVAGAALVVFRDKIFRRAPSVNGETVVLGGPEEARRHGGFGLGAWNTQVEFSNVVVIKGTKTLYQSDFSSGAAGWRIFKGNWIATNGVFRQTAQTTDCRATTGSSDWSDYTVCLRARKLGGDEGFLVLFNVADDRNWTWWNLGGWNNTRHALEDCVAGTKSHLGNSVSGRIETGRWYDVRVELSGSSIRCYLDAALIQSSSYESSPARSSGRQQGSSGSAPPSPVGPGIHEGAWTMDLAGARIPETAARGEAHGGDFECDRSVLQGGVLHLRQGTVWPPDLGFSVYLPEKRNEALGNKSISVSVSDVGVPRVTLRWKENQEPRTESFKGNYAMKLEFGGIVSNRISGRIYLCLPDEAKSHVAGTFNAELREPSTSR